jgi:hypothetical protein
MSDKTIDPGTDTVDPSLVVTPEDQAIAVDQVQIETVSTDSVPDTHISFTDKDCVTVYSTYEA